MDGERASAKMTVSPMATPAAHEEALEEEAVLRPAVPAAVGVVVVVQPAVKVRVVAVRSRHQPGRAGRVVVKLVAAPALHRPAARAGEAHVVVGSATVAAGLDALDVAGDVVADAVHGVALGGGAAV